VKCDMYLVHRISPSRKVVNFCYTSAGKLHITCCCCCCCCCSCCKVYVCHCGVQWLMQSQLSTMNHRSGAPSHTTRKTFVSVNLFMPLSLLSASTDSPILRAATDSALDFCRISIVLSRWKLQGDTLVSFCVTED